MVSGILPSSGNRIADDCIHFLRRRIERCSRPEDEALKNGTFTEVHNLKTYFYTQDGVVKAVDNVSYDVNRGETIALVGESGCGKTVSALSILRLVAEPAGRIVAGKLFLMVMTY